MELHGISFDMKHQAPLEESYIPIKKWNDAYLENATSPYKVAIERNDGLIDVYDTFVYGDEEHFEADVLYISKLVKMLIWARGGFRIYLSGNSAVGQEVAGQYTETGKRAFDVDYMQRVYGEPFEALVTDYEDAPELKHEAVAVGKDLHGYRIGFDAGGSDRKVSAVVDGEAIYSEEVVWFPKLNADPQYHYDGILDSMKTAASKMPRVDGIGISSAGIYINNETKVASLFLQVPDDIYQDTVANIYTRVTEEVAPGKPVVVANDGDVSALAGAMALEKGKVVGIAMGTSEAVGYVDADGNLTGYLNELAFSPVDLQDESTAEQDEWSGDYGVGCKYFSQDAAIRLAKDAGLEVDPELSLAEKLKVIQGYMEEDNELAQDIYRSIGVYLAYTLAYYSDFYDIEDVILMGRVVSGKGGDLILSVCNDVLADEYPELAEKITVMLPNEKIRRVGQSAAAASLPTIPK